MIPTLRKRYQDIVVPRFMESRQCGKMQVPIIRKIVLNLCVLVDQNRDILVALASDLSKITGQKAAITKAKKSVANFKLRAGMPIGARVTLRGNRMYEFMDRLVNTALPRVRDFRGISGRSFDGQGNYSMGLTEQTVFPEIDPDKVKKNHGMDITFVTSAMKDDEAKELLSLMGMPFSAERN